MSMLVLAERPDVAARRGRPARSLWFALGLLSVGVGLVGAFVPLLPTTGFLILALACFARSSPRLEAWLLSHPRFGPGLRAWRAEGAVPRSAKIAACAGMAVGYGLFWFAVRPDLWLALVVAAMLAGCAAYIVSRPAPSVSGGSDGL